MAITIETGKVTGSEIGKNKDGTKDVILLQCEITDPEDIQTVELMNQTGEDNHPIIGSRVTIVGIGDAYKIAIASDDINGPETTPGEKRLYGTDSDGNIVSEAILHDDGKIETKNDKASSVLEANGDIDAQNDNCLINATNAGVMQLTASQTIDLTAPEIGLNGNITHNTTGGSGSATFNSDAKFNGNIEDKNSVQHDVHDHDQPNDSDGDVEQDTGGPKNP